MKTKLTSLLFAKTILHCIFFIICYVGFISVHTANSDTLDNWHQRGAGVTTEYLQGIVYGKNTFIAFGRNGAIVSSADGTLLTSKSGDNWEVRNLSTNSDLRSIVFGQNTVVAVGENGLILQSDPIDPNNVSQQSDGGGGSGCFIDTYR